MIGDRIRQARLASGLTLDDVVNLLTKQGSPITKQGLSNYEKNKRRPRPTIIISLAKAVGVNPSYYFYSPKINIKWLAYRRQSSLRKRYQETIEAYAKTVTERHMYLLDTLFPNEKPIFPNRMKIRNLEEAERVAGNLRDLWSLGEAPIESLTQTIENKCGIVVEYPVSDIKFDGLSGFVNDKFPLLVVNSAMPDDRLRFDLAHELGHLVIDCEDLPRKNGEKLAHRFAGALLAPEKSLFQEFGKQRRALTFEEIGLLKKKYGLSMQALLYRICDLGIISDRAHKEACKTFSRKGWRKQEPVEYRGDEKPTRLKQMTLRALSEDIITQEKAEELCSGCLEEVFVTKEPETRAFSSPQELMKLSRSKRKEILARAAIIAEKEYRNNKELTDFEAFGEDDLGD